MIKKLFAGCAVWGLASASLLISKSGGSNDLVFGNYSDYIAPSVAEELKGSYGLRVDLFDYDHLVKERFEKGIYDVAITSTSVLSELKSAGTALKLDWNKLIGDGKEISNSKKTVKEAKELFTPIVQNISGDLLEYGIPYFIQKLGFYYRGSEIPSLSNKSKVSFSKLIEEVSKDDRFKSKKGKAQLGLIDDPRTVLSFARKAGGKEDVNPKDTDYKNSEEILEDYKKLIDKGLNKSTLGENFLFMHSDSGPLVDALSSGTIKGAFMYNGDGLFAANGGNAETKINKEDFHYVDLSENIYFLDFLTFSSKMSDEKKEKAYKLAKELMFLKTTDDNQVFKEKGPEKTGAGEAGADTAKNCEPEKEEDDEDETEYEEMAVSNFDEVQYTPTLKKIYDNLKENYFEYDDDDVSGEKTKCKKYVLEKTKHEIIKVEQQDYSKLSQDYEKQLTPQQKSDMLIAYSKFKSLL